MRPGTANGRPKSLQRVAKLAMPRRGDDAALAVRARLS